MLSVLTPISARVNSAAATRSSKHKIKQIKFLIYQRAKVANYFKRWIEL